MFNIVDYAAVSFPTGISADKTIDKLEQGYEPMSAVDADVQKEYDAGAVDGMPVSLQLVANRLEEEKVIAMTRLVLKAL